MGIRIDHWIDGRLVGRSTMLWALALPVALLGVPPWLVVLVTWNQTLSASDIPVVIDVFYWMLGYGVVVATAWFVVASARIARVRVGFNTVAVPLLGFVVLLGLLLPAHLHGQRASETLAQQYRDRTELILWATGRSEVHPDFHSTVDQRVLNLLPESLRGIVKKCSRARSSEARKRRSRPEVVRVQCLRKMRPLVVQWILFADRAELLPSKEERRATSEALAPSISYLQRSLGTGKILEDDTRLNAAHKSRVLRHATLLVLCGGPWFLLLASAVSRRTAAVGLVTIAAVGAGLLLLLADEAGQSRQLPADLSLGIWISAGVLWLMLAATVGKSNVSSLLLALHLTATPWTPHLMMLSENWTIRHGTFDELTMIGTALAWTEALVLLLWLRRYDAAPLHPLFRPCRLAFLGAAYERWRSKVRRPAWSALHANLLWLIRWKLGGGMGVVLVTVVLAVTGLAPMSRAAVPDVEVWFSVMAAASALCLGWWLGSAIQRRGRLGRADGGAPTMAVAGIVALIFVVTPFIGARVIELRIAKMYRETDEALRDRAGALHAAVPVYDWGERGANHNAEIVKSGELEDGLSISLADRWQLMDALEEKTLEQWLESIKVLRNGPVDRLVDVYETYAWEAEGHVQMVTRQSLPRVFDCLNEHDGNLLARPDLTKTADCGFSVAAYSVMARPHPGRDEDAWKSEVLGNLRRILVAGCDGSPECSEYVRVREGLFHHQAQTQGLACILLLIAAALPAVAVALAQSMWTIAAAATAGLSSAALYWAGTPWWGLAVVGIVSLTLAARLLATRDRLPSTTASVAAMCGMVIASLCLLCAGTHRWFLLSGMEGPLAAVLSATACMLLGCTLAFAGRNVLEQFMSRPLSRQLRRKACATERA